MLYNTVIDKGYMMINTFEQYLNEAKQLPNHTAPSEVSKKAGNVFDSMANGIYKKTVAKFDSTVIEDRGEIVYMFANRKPIMAAYKSETGASVEFCFSSSTAVDRCAGWNLWNGREFEVVYSNGKPYAVVGSDYNKPELLTHVELSKTKWYDESTLEDICKM